MALTFTATKSTVDTGLSKSVLGFQVVVGTFNLGASYTTGGEALAASDVDSTGENTTIASVICGPSEDGTILYAWDSTNETVIAYDAVGTEEASTTDLSAAAKSCQAIVTLY